VDFSPNVTHLENTIYLTLPIGWIPTACLLIYLRWILFLTLLLVLSPKVLSFITLLQFHWIFNLLHFQLSRLQLILNSTARAVSKTPKCSHIPPVLQSLHWLKIEQNIHGVISLRPMYKTLEFNKAIYLMTCSTFIATETPAPLKLSLSNVLLFAPVWN